MPSQVHQIETQHHIAARGDGRSSCVAHAAYIEASSYHSIREGRTWTYGREAERVADSAVLLPASAPQDWKDPERLWNDVERLTDDWIERYYRKQAPEFREDKKANARTDIRGIISFKRELGSERAMEIASDWTRRAFVERGYAVHLVVHDDGGDNLHIHYAATVRTVMPDGTLGKLYEPVGRKADWVQWMDQTRAELAHVQNARLAELGLGHLRVEHRSHAERGISLTPTLHEGAVAHAIEYRGGRSKARGANAAVSAQNRDAIDANPWVVSEKISATQATFTGADLDRELNRLLGGDEALIERARASILADQRLVTLGEDARGHVRYSTREYLAAEAGLYRSAEQLSRRSEHHGDGTRFAATLDKAEITQGWRFSAQQRQVMEATVNGSDLTLIVGRAGAGKTTLMRQVAAELGDTGYRMRGLALAGKAADNLSAETGVRAQTIDSLLTVLRHRDEARDSARRGDSKSAAYLQATADHAIRRRDVIIVDEAGMIDTRKMAELLSRIEQAGAKAIVVGDPDQLAAIGAGSAMRGMLERGAALELDEIFRQRDPEMRAASRALAVGDFAAGIGHYRQSGAIAFSQTREEAKVAIVAQYLADHAASPQKSQAILAFRNSDVDDMNRQIKAALKSLGKIPDGELIATERGPREMSVGDRIVFGANNKEIGVFNGSTGVVQSVTRGDDGAYAIAVQLDGERGSLVRFSTSDYSAIDHAWALTTHKSQGQSIAQTYLLADSGGLLRRDGAYVAFTRHTERLRVYGSREEFKQYEDLVHAFSREPVKDMAADFAASPELHRVRDYVRSAEQVTTLHREVSSVGTGKRWDEHARFGEYAGMLKERERLAKEIASDWAAHKTPAANARLSRDAIEHHAGKPRALTEREREAERALRAYAEKAAQARDTWNRIKMESPSIGRTHDHREYPQYDAMRSERDAKASEIVAARKLYRPLFREAGVNERALAAHARGHAMRQQVEIELIEMATVLPGRPAPAVTATTPEGPQRGAKATVVQPDIKPDPLADFIANTSDFQRAVSARPATPAMHAERGRLAESLLADPAALSRATGAQVAMAQSALRVAGQVTRTALRVASTLAHTLAQE